MIYGTTIRDENGAVWLLASIKEEGDDDEILEEYLVCEGDDSHDGGYIVFGLRDAIRTLKEGGYGSTYTILDVGIPLSFKQLLNWVRS